MAAVDREEYPAAEEFFNRAAAILESVEDETDKFVSCVKNVASLKLRRGAGDAESALKQARALAKTHELPEHELDCVRGLVGLARKNSNAPDEEHWLEETLAIVTRLGKKKDQAQSHHLLRGLAALRGDQAAAKRHGENALALFRELGNDEGISVEAYLQGVFAYNDGELERAYTIFKESQAAAERSGQTRFLIDSLRKLGDIDYRRDRFDSAERFLHRSLTLAEEAGDIQAQALVSYTLGCVAEERGDQRQKLERWLTAIERAREAGDRKMAAEIEQLLSEG